MSRVWCRARRCRRTVAASRLRPARARTVLIWRTIARSRRVATAACATSGGVATGMESVLPGGKRKARTLAPQKARNCPHKLRRLQPGPVAGAGHDLRGGVGQRGRVRVREARGDVGIALAPDHERRACDALQLLAR